MLNGPLNMPPPSSGFLQFIEHGLMRLPLLKTHNTDIHRRLRGRNVSSLINISAPTSKRAA
jgi:hypothetical protein